jgi:hypothetical protein
MALRFLNEDGTTCVANKILKHGYKGFDCGENPLSNDLKKPYDCSGNTISGNYPPTVDGCIKCANDCKERNEASYNSNPKPSSDQRDDKNMSKNMQTVLGLASILLLVIIIIFIINRMKK